ncbi:ABC-2 family transporter protein [compost metagenome]
MREIVAIIKYDILANKSSKYVIQMIIYPIIFTLILGFLLKNAFSSSFDMEHVNIVYLSDKSEQSKQIIDVFKSLEDELDISISEEENQDEAKELVKRNTDTVFIELKDNIKIYKNDGASISSEVVYGVLNTIVDKFNVAYSIGKVSPEGLSKINFQEVQREFTNFKQIELKKEMTSYDYYGVAEFTMMILYISMFSFNLINAQRRNGTEGRVFIAGVSKIQYIIARTLSMAIFNFVIMTIPFLILKFIVGVEYGTDYLTFIAIMGTLNLLSSAIGVAVGFLVKDENVGDTILQAAVVPTLSLLGGSYVYLGEDINYIFDLFTKISPLRWANRAMINVIYAGDYGKVGISIAVNLGLTILLILISYIKIKGEERLA